MLKFTYFLHARQKIDIIDFFTALNTSELESVVYSLFQVVTKRFLNLTDSKVRMIDQFAVLSHLTVNAFPAPDVIDV